MIVWHWVSNVQFLMADNSKGQGEATQGTVLATAIEGLEAIAVQRQLNKNIERAESLSLTSSEI